MKHRLLVVVGAVLLFSLVALPNASASTAISADPNTTARVRIIHASPDAPNVDVFVDDVKKLADVRFFTISDYLVLSAGIHNIKIRTANTTTTLINVTPNVDAGVSYSVAVVGEAAAGSTNSLQAAIITDNLVTPSAGFAQIRAYHFSPGTPPVQIRVAGGPTLVTNIAFPDVSAPLIVQSGTYTLEVALADGGPAALAVLTLPAVKLEAGKLYDFYALGSGPTLRIEPRVIDTTAKVRVIHAAPGAPNVDVYSGQTKILADVPFFTITDYLTVSAASTRFRVVPTGSELASAIIDTTLVLNIGRFYTISAVGQVPSISAVVSEDDLSAPAPGTSRVRVYHFSPNTPAVGVRIKNGATLIPSIAFKQISQDAELPAGRYDLEVFLAPNGPTAQSVDGLQLDSGRIYDIFATDLFPNTKLESRIYGPNATVPYSVLLPIVSN